MVCPRGGGGGRQCGLHAGGGVLSGDLWRTRQEESFGMESEGRAARRRHGHEQPWTYVSGRRWRGGGPRSGRRLVPSSGRQGMRRRDGQSRVRLSGRDRCSRGQEEGRRMVRQGGGDGRRRRGGLARDAICARCVWQGGLSKGRRMVAQGCSERAESRHVESWRRLPAWRGRRCERPAPVV